MIICRPVGLVKETRECAKRVLWYDLDDEDFSEDDE